MVIYNPKDWWKLIFSFHKSDTFRMTWRGMMAVGIYTALVAYIENEIFHATFKNTTAIHSLVGFVLSLLLVLRTNTAYDRWWEGRKLWGGMLTSTRNFAFKLNSLPIDEETKASIKNLLVNFFIASKEHLRNGVKIEILIPVNEPSLQKLESSSHVPNLIVKTIYHIILNLKNNISDEKIKMLDQELGNLTHHLGACERIKRTPMPYSYNLYLKKILFIYIFTMPIGFVREFGYWAVPIVALLFYVFTSIEILAEEIEDPFGLEPNDLPTDELTENISKNLDEIFRD
ncbi:MAG: hypothetical protein IPM48_12425 [Saprospiraceae bacterium]|nr:hypothetical protein [Saprospiraceae bacterium]